MHEYNAMYFTKDGWSANVVDKKDKIQIKIGE
jgi:hypothetical protein